MQIHNGWNSSKTYPNREYSQMKFKEWLELNELRNKGFYRQFVQQNPQMPDHVRKDLYKNRIGFSLKKMVSPDNSIDMPTQSWNTVGASPTMGITRTSASQLPSNTPSRIINAHNLENIQWPKKPSPVQITPLVFDEQTLNMMIQRRFGFKESPSIRNDANRMATQRNMLPEVPTGDNEPIIMIKNGNKYKLLEGWHRTMTYLVFDHNEHIGAPQDQVELLKNGGDLNNLDFSRWRPVLIKAFIGMPIAQQPQTIQQNPNLNQTATT